jgi:hypothetical protein
MPTGLLYPAEKARSRTLRGAPPGHASPSNIAEDVNEINLSFLRHLFRDRALGIARRRLTRLARDREDPTLGHSRAKARNRSSIVHKVRLF